MSTYTIRYRKSSKLSFSTSTENLSVEKLAGIVAAFIVSKGNISYVNYIEVVDVDLSSVLSNFLVATGRYYDPDFGIPCPIWRYTVLPLTKNQLVKFLHNNCEIDYQLDKRYTVIGIHSTMGAIFQFDTLDFMKGMVAGASWIQADSDIPPSLMEMRYMDLPPNSFVN